MKIKLVIILILGFACNSKSDSDRNNKPKTQEDQIVCTDEKCFGTYTGKEFINGSDIAHQYSNKMSEVVGDKLKELFEIGKYSKVDFTNIQMITEGMGTGIVTYILEIPFTRVSSKCKAYTSFDHVGGWNHSPELSKRKEQLKNALLVGDELDISELKLTKEGLQEYWIQWRNKDKQRDCIIKE